MVGWVFAAIRAISLGCAGADLNFHVPGMRIPRPLPQQHPLHRLFRKVNPVHTYRELVGSCIADLEIYGNSYWYLSPGAVSGVPVELWPLPPASVHIVPGGDDVVSHFTLRRGGRTVRLEPRDVIHFTYPNPFDRFFGRSTLDAAIDAIYADDSLIRAQRRTYDMMPVPGAVFKSAVSLTDEQKVRMTAKLKSIFHRPLGSPDPEPVFLSLEKSDEDKVESVGLLAAPRDMDFGTAARIARDKLLSVFGVPPAVLGLVVGDSPGDVRAAHEAFARFTLIPKLKLLADQITQKIADRFVPEGIVASFSSPIPPDKAASAREMDIAMKHNLLTREEARERYFGIERTTV